MKTELFPIRKTIDIFQKINFQKKEVRNNRKLLKLNGSFKTKQSIHISMCVKQTLPSPELTYLSVNNSHAVIKNYLPLSPSNPIVWYVILQFGL